MTSEDKVVDIRWYARKVLDITGPEANDLFGSRNTLFYIKNRGKQIFGRQP